MKEKNNAYYLGIDLNDRFAMVSYYQLNMNEPETVSTIAGGDNYQIPLVLARKKEFGQWYYGDEARKMTQSGDLICVDNLLRKAVEDEKILIENDSFNAEDLLALFISKVMLLPQKLGNPKKCDRLVITVDRLTKQNMKMFWNILPKLGLNSEQFMIIDHKESFYYFALSQAEELWLHDVVLFEYESDYIRQYHLNRDMRTRPQMISINESARYTLEGNRDVEFENLAQKNFENKIISTVYLVGDGFEGGWMQKSLSYLCRGRRAFMGKNLFSKGACYAAAVRDEEENWPFVYMGENEMKFNLSIKVRDKGELSFYNLISAGKNWFELKGQCEVILVDSCEIDFWKQLPNSREAKIETLELTDMPTRPDRTTRVRITAVPTADDKIDIDIKDLGFGEIFRSSDKVWHYTMSM